MPHLFIAAGACFAETFPLFDANAEFQCNGNEIDLSCTRTCKDGYLYKDGTSSQIVSCAQVGTTNEFAWNSMEPMVCLRKYHFLWFFCA